MKINKGKRAIAIFGAALMLLQAPLGHLPVMAHSVTTESVVEDADVNVQGESLSENSVVSCNSVQIEEEKEQIKQGNLLLNYVYMDQAKLDVGQKQNVLVEVGDESTLIKNASLILENTESVERYTIPMADCAGNAVRFEWDTTGMKIGVYRVVGITYVCTDGKELFEGSIEFEKVPDMENVCFGLGVENPINSSEFTEYNEFAEEVEGLTAQGISESDTVEGLDVNIVSLKGADENETGADRIAEAIGHAKEEVKQEEITAQTAAGAQTNSESGQWPQVRKVAGSLVVMLDPGHDETHIGAKANGLNEEDLTLKVAKYCKEYLEKTYSDVVVYMTRETSACPYPGTTSGNDNSARVDAAQQKGADVYVSIHFNSTVGTTTATGAIVFYPNSNYNSKVGSKGAALAAKIIEQLEKVGLKNNGIRIRNSENNSTYPDGSLADYYGVINRSKLYGIPAVIVEHAFINNPVDAAFLQSEENLKKLGIADALGIAQAYNLSTEEVEFDAEDLQVTQMDGVNGTFRITLFGATPESRIAKVGFKVYPTEAKDKYYLYTAEKDAKEEGVYSVVGNVSNHDKMTGKYKVIAYAYDAAGKKTQLRSATFDVEKTKFDSTGMKISSKVSATEKTVTLKLKGNEQAAGVYFRVYSNKNGTDDVKTYHATKLENGEWKATVTVSKHKNAGLYKVVAYSKTYFGTKEKVATSEFTIEGPTVSGARVYKQNLTKGTFQIRAYDAQSAVGLKSVIIKVKNLEGKKKTNTYTAKKNSKGFHYVDVDMKDYGYAYGDYKIEVIASDKNGFEEVVDSFTHTFEQPEPVITAKLKSKHTKISMSASDLGISANVKAVKFRVYNTDYSSKKKYYEAKKGKDGTWTASAKVADFGTSGTYKILVYVKGVNGKYQKLSESVKLVVPDVKGGKIKVKKKSDSASYLYVSGIDYKGAIGSVQVKVWPKANTKAKYLYTASLRSDGSYRVTISSKNHKGIGGDYSYRVTVKTKNGISKEILKGTMRLGESIADTGELYAIGGSSSVTVAQMMAYYKKYAVYPKYYTASDAPSLKKFCQMYYEECEKEGIRAEVAFAQAMKETNFLRYGGDVDISQYNFAGIGATGGGAKGVSFASVRIGIRAQVQHLKAYANSEPLNLTCVDPRFQYVQRGCAPYVEWLGIETNPYGKGWATDPTYGSSLRRMITELRNC